MTTVYRPGRQQTIGSAALPNIKQDGRTRYFLAASSRLAS